MRLGVGLLVRAKRSLVPRDACYPSEAVAKRLPHGADIDPPTTLLQSRQRLEIPCQQRCDSGRILKVQQRNYFLDQQLRQNLTQQSS